MEDETKYAEDHWERLMLCVEGITTSRMWLNGEMLASSSLDEQRKWVSAWEPDDDKKDVGREAWEFWQDLG